MKSKASMWPVCLYKVNRGRVNLLVGFVMTFLAIHTGWVMFKEFKKLVSSWFSNGLDTVANAPERMLHSLAAVFHCRRLCTYS